MATKHNHKAGVDNKWNPDSAKSEEQEILIAKKGEKIQKPRRVLLLITEQSKGTPNMIETIKIETKKKKETRKC